MARPMYSENTVFYRAALLTNLLRCPSVPSGLVPARDAASSVRARLVGVLLAVGLFGMAAAADDAKDRLNLIPWPKSVRLDEGFMALGTGSRIVATSRALAPLARILSGEIRMATGLRLAVAASGARPGDVVLRIDRDLKTDAGVRTVVDRKVVYTRDGADEVRVDDRALVRGFDYRAVAEGTATLLQLLMPQGGAQHPAASPATAVRGQVWGLPRVDIHDWPHADYAGAMLDVARQENSPEYVEQNIEVCRLYKVRYLQLHLSDDHGWTFPSTAFPLLGSRNLGAHSGLAPKLYSVREMREMVRYADERGLTLVPEMETPGHSGAARRAMPAPFGSAGGRGGGPDLDVMNMASDELYPALDTLVGEICGVFKSSPFFHIGCDETDLGVLAQQPEAQAYMKAHGIADVQALFVRHIQRMVQSVEKRGKQTIVWEGAAVDPATMKDHVVVMTWSDHSRAADWMIAHGFTTITVPWNYAEIPWPEWTMYDCNGSLLKRTDPVLGAMVPIWEQAGETALSMMRNAVPRRQERTWGPDNTFTEEDFARRVAATDDLVGRLIRPVTIHEDGMLDSEGTLPLGTLVFGEGATIQLECSRQDGRIRYTLDGGEPTAASPAYEGPITLSKSATVTAAFFDAAGVRQGFPSARSYRRVDYERNLTTGKPATASSIEAGHGPEYAVDGQINVDRAWWAAPYPQWLQVDLQGVYKLGSVRVYPYWDGSRYYRYTVELSVDAKSWVQVADMSQNTRPATESGDLLRFEPRDARYVRVNMLYNSANQGVHLVQVRVYAP